MGFKKSLPGLIVALLLASLAWPQVASAQRSSYNRGREHIAGQFDYFQLVLSWSPTHCADNSRGRNDTQCGLRRERPYAFVLHGLWPQYERGYPQNCRTAQRPFVPNNVINGILDIMPSRGLVIHEYRKHGTCSGLRPYDYFRVSRALFKRIKIPAIYRQPKKVLFTMPNDLALQFARINPGLKPAMIKVVCKRGPANKLREIRICISRKGTFRPCGGRARHQCAQRKIFIPPVR